MASRNYHKRRTAERKARQRAEVHHDMLIRVAEELGGSGACEWSKKRIATFILFKRPGLRLAVQTVQRLFDVDGVEETKQRLRAENNPQAEFLLAMASAL